MNPAGRPLRIMVVEPDRAILEMLQLRLGVAGHEVVSARTAAASFAALMRGRPDVLFLELSLPDADGMAVLEALNGGEASETTPTIVTGARFNKRQVGRAIELGAEHCLLKPFGAADALDRLDQLLRRGAPEREPAASVVYV